MDGRVIKGPSQAKLLMESGLAFACESGALGFSHHRALSLRQAPDNQSHSNVCLRREDE